MLFLVRRWVAGDDADAALRVVRALRARGFLACVDYLGEHDADRASVQRSMDEYLRLVPRLRGLGADVSLKPSELGLDISAAEAARNIEAILAAARKAGVGAWLDMESTAYTDRTIALYLALHRRYRFLGIAIQANLRRTPRDLDRLVAARARIRLVKGAYQEPAALAHQGWPTVTARFRALLVRLLKSQCFIAVATHDKAMLAVARAHERRGMEFQMLLGIADRSKRELADAGCAVRVYVPYGKRWEKYVLRRIRERKRDAFRMIRLAFS